MCPLELPAGRGQSLARCIALFLRPFSVEQEGGLRFDIKLRAKLVIFFQLTLPVDRLLTFFKPFGASEQRE